MALSETLPTGGFRTGTSRPADPPGSGAPREGLTPAQVEQSRKQHGSNQLTQKKRNSFFRQFLSSFGDPIIKILLITLAVNVLFLFRHFDWYESAGIALAIFLATFVSTLSEHGSEAAFARLQEDADRIFCRVRRAGQVAECPIGDIVVGDLVLSNPANASRRTAV